MENSMPPAVAPAPDKSASPFSLAAAFGTIPDAWTPKHVGRIEDREARLVRLKPEARWRQHFAADEMFLVVGGVMRMRFRDRVEDVAQGAFIIVPAGVEHKAEALTQECQVVMFGRAEARDAAA
jgi:mannose-6-phosphate isomerase-like protein (cupin superfamily)